MSRIRRGINAIRERLLLRRTKWLSVQVADADTPEKVQSAIAELESVVTEYIDLVNERNDKPQVVGNVRHGKS